MKHNLFLMCGVPGAGKSTWLAKQNAYTISRDEIRFSLIKNGEDYFSKEDEVFKRFINEIQENIDSDDAPEDIYCDATHITKKSRNKVLKSLDLTNVNNITVIVIRPSLTECLRRNAKREGRRCVPNYVIRRMYVQFQPPEDDENKIFDVIYVEVPKYE